MFGWAISDPNARSGLISEVALSQNSTVLQVAKINEKVLSSVIV